MPAIFSFVLNKQKQDIAGMARLCPRVLQHDFMRTQTERRNITVAARTSTRMGTEMLRMGGNS